MSTPTSVWPPLTSRSDQKIGSSKWEPIGNAKNHSLNASSEPVTLRRAPETVVNRFP